MPDSTPCHEAVTLSAQTVVSSEEVPIPTALAEETTSTEVSLEGQAHEAAAITFPPTTAIAIAIQAQLTQSQTVSFMAQGEVLL
mmetsp:Transcript_54648/g.127797  ORF Transcript_54648/g.127797 Transcript_54648/m.127797 type:complete len:84 (-) Transcript_54648:1721-1972(-)